MFDKRLLCTGAAIVAVGMIAVVASSLPAKIENVQLENLSDVEISSSTSEQLDYEYILREYSGRIAVFAVNSENPDMVLDVMVKYLS